MSKGFYVEWYCLHCGGELRPDAKAKVSEVEATVHATCAVCKSGATIRVLYSNGRGLAPTPITPAVLS